jgi:hypothetical protein
MKTTDSPITQRLTLAVAILVLVSFACGPSSPTPLESASSTSTPRATSTLIPTPSPPSATPTLVSTPTPPAPSAAPTASATPTVRVASTPSAATAEVLFTASNVVMALATDPDDNVYAVTIDGNLIRIAPDGSSENLYTGLERCGFSNRTVAVLPDGNVVVNDCVDTQDTLVQIDQKGNTSTLLQLEESLITMASDPAGNLYLGYWTSEGDISIEFRPTYLSGADYIDGRIAMLKPDGQLDNLYEGRIPLSIAAPREGHLYAALWGDKGRFKAEPKSYTMCGPTKNFWIAFSDNTTLQQILPDSTGSPTDGVFSYIAPGRDEVLYAFGNVKEEPCGIYIIEPAQEPERLTFIESDVDKKITTMTASVNNVYFADVDGNVYRAAFVNPD